MLQRKKATRPGLMLAPLMLLLASCAGGLTNWSPPVAPVPTIPPLPAEARQPAIPSECLPTCSKGLTAERESWLRLLTPAASQGSRVSGPTMR